jgi:sugar/nucleoside kinase (ribokinase family)
MRLVIVGSVAYDTYSTPFGKVRDALGGAATHAALAASRLTQGLGVVGVVGTDFKAADLRLLEAQGISTQGVERAQGRTFRWTGRYTGSMGVAETLKTELGVFGTFDPVLPSALRGPAFLFLANIHPLVQLKVLQQAGRPRFTLLDTMNYWIASQKPALLKVIRKVDGLIVNDQEARQLTGKSTLIQAARAILAQGPKVLILKRGEHGASLYLKGGQSFHVPAYAVERVLDPTGAGDSFAGGFIGHLARRGAADGLRLREAMLYGTAMASFNVEDFSVRRVLKVTRPAVEARVRELRTMIRL